MTTKKQRQHSQRINRLPRRLSTENEISPLSAEQVANEIGVATSTYREWENGRAITGQPYIRLAKCLSVSVYQLFGIEDHRRDEISTRLNAIERLTRETKNLL